MIVEMIVWGGGVSIERSTSIGMARSGTHGCHLGKGGLLVLLLRGESRLKIGKKLVWRINHGGTGGSLKNKQCIITDRKSVERLVRGALSKTTLNMSGN